MRRGDAAPWAWAVWLLAVGAVLAYGVWRTWSVHEAALAQLETVEPRFARLTGLGQDRERLREALETAAAALERHVYPGSRDVTQAGNDAQQRARDVFTKAGLDVVSIQLLPARGADQFERIPITLRVEGDMPALQAALATLPTLSPSLFVQGITMNGTSGTQAGRALRVVAQIELFALRERA